MKDYNYVTSNGNRTTEQWDKVSGKWTVSTTRQSGIRVNSTDFTCVNGTGGDPKHVLPTANSFTKSRRTYGSGIIISGDPYQSYSVTSGASFGTSMSPGGSPPSLDTSFASLQNRNIAKLGDAVRGDLDLAIDLFEADQSVRMIRNVIRLENYIRSFHPKKWASKWLEYQYGWRPMVNSIYGLAKEFSTPPKEGVAHYKFRSREVLSKVANTTPFSGVTDSWKSELFKRSELRVNLDFKPSFWTQAARISSLNPASILWELCPYSFVADWLYNIGGYLKGLETAFVFGLAFKSGYVTNGSLRIDTGRRAGLQKTGGTSFTSYSGCEHIYRTTTKSRTVLTSFPTPSLPSLEVNLGASRILSGASLLFQFFEKGNGTGPIATPRRPSPPFDWGSIADKAPHFRGR